MEVEVGVGVGVLYITGVACCTDCVGKARVSRLRGLSYGSRGRVGVL